eukprot:TRINITY_DN7704_c0_g1_i4.p1 TRINITY_DN7704_c0_g1~~TRINITY_DN7704_c0_g1_i4.p1  ORF type:complete len:199 (+),score=60.78 TRINITY_DN7704_c0_g1_i4:109-705(+)
MAPPGHDSDLSCHPLRYWKREINDAHVLGDNKPQKLDGAEATKAPDASPANAIGSMWNKAGTWEEKEIGAQARPALEQIFTREGFYLLRGEGTELTVKSATVTGDAQAFHIRGRPRIGFELKVRLKWAGTFEGADVDGDLEIPELDSSDLDGFELRLTPKGGDDAAKKKAADALKKSSRPSIKAAAEELIATFLEGAK